MARRLHLLSTERQSWAIGDKINDPHFENLDHYDDAGDDQKVFCRYFIFPASSSGHLGEMQFVTLEFLREVKLVGWWVGAAGAADISNLATIPPPGHIWTKLQKRVNTIAHLKLFQNIRLSLFAL